MKCPTVGIATDGAHSAKERLTRYRAVDLSSGMELFNHSIGNWTNNIGEFLGIVEAVKYILTHPEAPRIIYSDSITAITWYKNKATASTKHCDKLHIILYTNECSIYLKTLVYVDWRFPNFSLLLCSHHFFQQRYLSNYMIQK